ncbi:MAG: hypothetical protein U5K81_13285 [Trueperaceae bacterium]|nr:hypothetical protein [Trueperaceae bacterium]
MGSTLLPIFWAPLIALFVFGSVPAFAAAALAPIVNNLVTGLPPTPALSMITVELVVFVVLVLFSMRWMPRNPLVAPACYAVAHTLVTVAFWLSSGAPESAWGLLGSSFQTALPGIVMLFLVNLAAMILQREEGKP